MKTFEFQATVGTPDTLPIPPDVAAQLKSDQVVRVVLLVADSGEDADWAKLTSQQFLHGYDAGDSIYDTLHAG